MRTPDLRYASFYPVPNIGLLPAGSNLKYNTVKGYQRVRVNHPRAMAREISG